MDTNVVKKVIEFVRDWNNGMAVSEMASKYAIKPATVRSRVASYRKQGIVIPPRRAQSVALSAADVKAINKELNIEKK